MRAATVGQVKSHFDAYLKASQDGPIKVTRNRKTVAVLLGGQDEDELERLAMAYSPKLRAILDRSYAQMKAGQVIPHDEFWAIVEAKNKQVNRSARTKRAE